MSHRPRDWGEEPDGGEVSSEGRAGRLASRVRAHTKERIVHGLRLVTEEPDPKIRRRKLVRRRIERTLEDIVDLGTRRDRRVFEDMFRNVCVQGRVPLDSDPEPRS